MSVVTWQVSPDTTVETEFFDGSENYALKTYIYTDDGYNEWYSENRWDLNNEDVQQLVDRYSDYTIKLSCEVNGSG